MNPSGPGDTAESTPQTEPSLEEGKALLTRSRLLGRVSAFIFILAVIAVIDGLQTLIRHEFNSVDIVPGEQLLVSGMLPGRARSHEELIVHMDGDSCLRFTPLETYKGFWMGGHMWRARLDAAPDCLPGKAVITVEDILPEEDKDKTSFAGLQNPALVFSINIFSSESERHAADNSLLRRLTSLPPFAIAAFAVLGALVAGLGNWLIFGRAEAILARHGVFFIHGVKELQNTGTGPFPVTGFKAAFAHAGKKFYRNEPVILYNRDWAEQGRGNVVEVTRIKAFALFPPEGARPRYGWLLARTEEE